MTNATSELLAIAAQASYSDQANLPNELYQAGFEVYVNPDTGEQAFFEDTKTGFVATVWHHPTTNEYIVAARGTNFESPQDWYTNIQLGKPQFESEGANKLRTFISTFDSNATIHFTGHSLGGALAQYFAYEYTDDQFAGAPYVFDITLTTFNSLGGELYQMANGGIDAARLANIDATHYRTEHDAVSKLGAGHLASGGNDKPRYGRTGIF